MDHLTILELIAAAFTTVCLLPQLLKVTGQNQSEHLNSHVWALLRRRILMSNPRSLPSRHSNHSKFLALTDLSLEIRYAQPFPRRLMLILSSANKHSEWSEGQRCH